MDYISVDRECGLSSPNLNNIINIYLLIFTNEIFLFYISESTESM